jgi:hypothetical protein
MIGHYDKTTKYDKRDYVVAIWQVLGLAIDDDNTSPPLRGMICSRSSRPPARLGAFLSGGRIKPPPFEGGNLSFGSFPLVHGDDDETRPKGKASFVVGRRGFCSRRTPIVPARWRA